MSLRYRMTAGQCNIAPAQKSPDYPILMNLPISEIRRPPGPEGPVALGIDAETLALLQKLQANYGNVVMMTKANGRDAIFINDAAAVRQLRRQR